MENECSLEQLADGKPLNEAAALATLKTAFEQAARCQPPGATDAQTISVVYSPAGCIGRIAFGGNRPRQSEVACMLQAFSQAKVEAFAGQPVRVHAVGTARQEFARVDILTRPHVQQFIRQHYPQIEQCYQARLSPGSTLKGQLTIRFTITPLGTVESAEDAGSELNDRQAMACVLRTFRGMLFPGIFESRINVVYPIIFAAPAGSDT